jgi:hypothetical protein
MVSLVERVAEGVEPHKRLAAEQTPHGKIIRCFPSAVVSPQSRPQPRI